MTKKHFTLLLFATLSVFHLMAQKITLLQQGKPTSIRGLSVVNDHVAWISGSKGYIAITNDGGSSWNWMQVKGFEKADFRDIEAFSNKEATIMASGTPALILKTTDGGKNWKVKYRNTDTTYFLDAMDFTGKKHGIVLGDPIKGKFLLLETNDFGETWHPFANMPKVISGEAAFAASGTCLRITGKSINIVTGGTAARHIYNNYSDKHWYSFSLPLQQGKQSQGAFSIDQSETIVVGGDYAKDKNTDSVACYFNADIKAIYHPAIKGPAGYQSCVEAINNTTYLSTGTSGSNMSSDGGRNWIKIDDGSFNVCRQAKHGNLVLLAGDHGRIALLKL